MTHVAEVILPLSTKASQSCFAPSSRSLASMSEGSMTANGVWSQITMMPTSTCGRLGGPLEKMSTSADERDTRACGAVVSGTKRAPAQPVKSITAAAQPEKTRSLFIR